MKRFAVAVWQGTGKTGTGVLTTQSKALMNEDYSYKSRFEEGNPGTNPEELVAAAHAGCFSMKLAFVLDEAGFKAEMLETTCSVKMEDGMISTSHLSLKAKIADITNEKFQELVAVAKDTCPISKSIKAAITFDASLLR